MSILNTSILYNKSRLHAQIELICEMDDIYRTLYSAVTTGDLGAVKCALTESAEFNARGRNIWYEFPYLHGAVNAEITSLLLDLGADVNATDKYRTTALHGALRLNKNLDVFDVLLQRGANVNATDCRGVTPLMLAIYYRNLGAVKKLMEHGADATLSLPPNCAGYVESALSTAMREKRKEAAKIIVKYTLKNHRGENLRKAIDLGQYSNSPIYRRISLYRDKCINELLRMKRIKLNKYITLYKLITEKNLVLPLYWRYDILEKLALSNYHIYHDVILPVVKICTERGVLYKKVADLEILRLITQDKEVLLNVDCIYKIAQYLSNEELENFIKSFFI